MKTTILGWKILFWGLLFLTNVFVCTMFAWWGFTVSQRGLVYAPIVMSIFVWLLIGIFSVADRAWPRKE